MRIIAPVAAVAAFTVSANLIAADTSALPQQARGLIKQFATTLQGELQSALKAGGTVEAVQVCKERAPAIAETLSEQSGWQVGRTSLKTRNTALNTPDDWERRVLKQFEARKAAGADPKSLTYAEVVRTDGGKVYRYMQAIPTTEVCLACHGANIDPALAETLDAAYPDDHARGFSSGDLRGAFTLSKPM